MIRVTLHLNDPNQRLMLKAMLERAHCEVVDERPDVAIHDEFEEAVDVSAETPALVVSTFGDIPRAVQAMARGVWGYILLPFLPDEAALMVHRAAQAGHAGAPFEPRPLAAVESEHILAVLRHCNGNRSRAAQLLGIGRNTLWRKLAAIERRTETAVPNTDDDADRS